MLLNRRELDKINFPGCSAAQCRLVIVLYDAFCLGTVEINISTARFAPAPMIGFYLKRLVGPSGRCNLLYTENSTFEGAILKSIRSSYAGFKLFSPFLADNEWEIQVTSLSHVQNVIPYATS
jgi:hypothetical protein